METSAALQTLNCSAGSISHAWLSLEKPAGPALSRSRAQSLVVGRLSSSVKQAGIIVSCAKTPETSVSSKSNVLLNDIPNGSIKKHALRSATFPSAFEALVTEVCDETSVAELQLKVGDFEMRLKRNIGGTNAPVPAPPPAPTEPIALSAPSAPAPSAPALPAPSTSASKPSSGKADPFTSASSLVSLKLARLEASGVTGYKLVTSPTVGSFRMGKTVKKKPPVCTQGNIIRKGQVLGYIEQFGRRVPVKADVAGEVLKLLVDDGEAVGYGDPLVAILPPLS
uniref:Acetyl-CoA carboxylase n=1 Tax=Opuntia streptacantha TaxID=393608 RepID=A0A7C8ZBN5_OPUST